jgi:predicted dehydrogenase
VGKARDTADWVASQTGDDVRAYGDARALLASGTVDALYVNTPVETHAGLCGAAIEVGCAVICEKPLAPTWSDAAALTRLAERAGVRTAVNFTYRSVLAFRQTARWLATHEGIGSPRHARFELLQGHNFLPNFRQASALLDSGCHLFDLMSALLELAGFGHVVRVRGEALAPQNPDYGWAFTAETGSGIVVPALFTRSALGWRNGLRWALSGEARALEVEADGAAVRARWATRGDGAAHGVWRVLDPPDDLAADEARFPAYHMDRLVGAVRGEESFPDFAVAAQTNRMAEALAASAHAEEWVRL